MSEKRPIHNKELVIAAFAEDMTWRATLRADRKWHIFRQTANGNMIGACDTAKNRLENGYPYYTVRFTPFLADAIAPQICFWCAQAIDLEERLQERTVLA